MSWLDTLLDRGLEAMQPANVAPAPIATKRCRNAAVTVTPPLQSAARQAEPAEIKSVWFQTRAPRDKNDLGEIDLGYYSIADGVLTMHDETGKPTGEEYRLRAGEDPHQAAGRLGKQAWIKARGETDFNRPLGYARFGNA
jgi:hypothetical protein